MEKNKKRLIRDIVEYLIIILVIVLIRTFVATPIRVQQVSMYPTLHPNDIMILNKIGWDINGVNRFDIVVIKTSSEYLIKRVVGLPGEYIEYKNNILYVNKRVVKENFTHANTDDFVLETIGYERIPKDKYFVLGDNRGNSTDSRIIGLIDRKDIVGKTDFILFPFKDFGLVK